MILVILVLCFVEFHIAESCVYGDGPGCKFPCRCTTEGCDPVTGTCEAGECADVLPSGHGYGWKGTGCRIGNIAYNKNTSQSGGWGGYTSDRAVDGNTDPNITHGSCVHPLKTGEEAWWIVDLGKKYVIEKIVIFNRDTAKFRTNNFDIHIGMNSSIDEQDLCISYTDGAEDVLPLMCTEDVTEGRYVSMRRHPGGDDKDPEIINICEFVVIGYEPIECSAHCSDTCNNGLEGCDTCDAGFKLPDCVDECNTGTWGTNCMNQCSDKCTSACNIRTGCDTCDAGYKPPGCVDECDSGKWGVNCKNTCGNCADGQPCDKEDGECGAGCAQWYLNKRCDGFIDQPSMAESAINTEVTSSTTLTVTWQQYNIDYATLAEYYFYEVAFGPTGRNKTLSGKHNHDLNVENLHLELTDLTYNTEYEMHVIPYRIQGTMEEIGIQSKVVYNKTQCKEPSIPYLTITKKENEWEINFQMLQNLESGCDNVTRYTLFISSDDAPMILHNISIWNESSISLPFDNQYDGYRIWTEVINNEEKSINSDRKQLKHSIATTASPSTASMRSENINEQRGTQPAPGPNIGAMAGGAAGGVVVIVVVVVVIVILVRRRRFPKSETENTDHILKSSSVLVMNENTASSSAADNVYANMEDVAFPTTCVKVSQLEAYIQHKQEEGDGFNHEYSAIPAGSIHPVNKASESKTVGRNRFKNIRAYDKSRVVLEIEGDEPSSDYINACFIPGYGGDSKHYIAGQGPLPHTICDHWRMIWQCNVTRIIMATNEVEFGKRKCERYWPDGIGDVKEYGHFTVTLKEVEEYADFTIRKLKCSKSDECKNVVQFHFTSWPDKTALEETWPLLQFRHKVKSYPMIGPLFVHCSAGIGRTGTYIAIDYSIERGLAEDKVDVHKCVTDMREYRMNMVQTQTQYEFIYKTLLEAFTFGNTRIPCVELDSTVSNKTSQKAKQYLYITKWTNTPSSSVQTYDGQSQDNKKKNRDMSIIPIDSYRPYLKTPWKGTNNYINAVYVNSYSRQKAFIVTQFPLSNTVVDFWRLVYDQNCSVIVSLGVMEQKVEPQSAEAVYQNYDEKNMSAFVPKEESKPETHGPFEVLVTKQTREARLTTRKITVQIPKHKNKVDTTHIEISEWADGELPDIDIFMEVIKQVEQLKLEKDGLVLISCLNGADKSGLLAAALYIVEYMKLEQEVDVVTAVRSVRKYRLQFVSNQQQYEYLYRVAQSYNKMFSTYANYL